MLTVQTMLTAIRDKGLNDAEIGAELDNTPQATVYRLRVGTHKGTSYQRYALIEDLYKRLRRKKAA
jgi:hypothetical protein